MNTEPNQVEGSAQDRQLSALCERLFKRHAEPIGIINVREAERLYERIIGWIAGRYNLLEQLLNRYRMDDLSGDGQPFVLEQSFWDLINASSAPAPSGALPSQTVSFPPVSQTEAYTSTPINPSAAPPTDSNTDSMQTSAAKFRVSRRPPPVSNLEQPDDWQSGGSAALKSTVAAHQPDGSQSTTAAREGREGDGAKLTQSASPQPQATASSSTAPEASDKRQPPLSLELAQASPSADRDSEPPLVDAAKPAHANQAPIAMVRELTNDAAERIPFSDPLLLKDDSPTQQPGDSTSISSAQTPHQPIEEAQTAEASQATKETLAAKRPAIAREIGPKAADAISPLEPPPLDLAQRLQSPLPTGERENADQKAAHVEREDEVRAPQPVDAARSMRTDQGDAARSVKTDQGDAARSMRTDQAATAPPVESRTAEATPSANAATPSANAATSSADEAPTVKRLAVARELTNHSAAALPFSTPRLLKDDSQVQQPSDSPSPSAAQSDSEREHHAPNRATEITRAQPDDEPPAQVRAPVSSQDSSNLQSAAEIKPAIKQAAPGAAMEMALTFGSTQTAQRDAQSSPSRAQEWSGNASQSRSPMAAEMQREPVNSQPVDFIWREGDDAAAEIARQQAGVGGSPTAPGFNGFPSTSLSSLDQRAAQPPTQEQSNQVNLEKIPDHVINTISQQVIRALSRILTVERERKGIR